MAKRISVNATSIRHALGLRENPNDAFADKQKWSEQNLKMIIKRKVKSGDFSKQVADFVTRKSYPIYRLSRGYYASTFETVERELQRGFGIGNLERAAKHQQGSTLIKRTTKAIILPGKPAETVPVESGRTGEPTPWRNLPLRYIALTGPRSKKLPPGFPATPYGKWKGLPFSAYFWRKGHKDIGGAGASTLLKAYSNWLNTAQLRPSYDPSIDGYTGANLAAYGLNWTQAALQKKLQSNYKSMAGKPLGRFEVNLPLRYPDLHNAALNRLIRQAFITGRPNVYRVFQGIGVKGGAPTDVSRIAYPEFRRPWVSRFAANMGRRHKVAMKKAIKKW